MSCFGSKSKRRSSTASEGRNKSDLDKNESKNKFDAKRDEYASNLRMSKRNDIFSQSSETSSRQFSKSASLDSSGNVSLTLNNVRDRATFGHQSGGEVPGDGDGSLLDTKRNDKSHEEVLSGGSLQNGKRNSKSHEEASSGVSLQDGRRNRKSYDEVPGRDSSQGEGIPNAGSAQDGKRNSKSHEEFTKGDSFQDGKRNSKSPEEFLRGGSLQDGKRNGESPEEFLRGGSLQDGKRNSKSHEEVPSDSSLLDRKRQSKSKDSSRVTWEENEGEQSGLEGRVSLINSDKESQNSRSNFPPKISTNARQSSIVIGLDSLHTSSEITVKSKTFSSDTDWQQKLMEAGNEDCRSTDLCLSSNTSNERESSTRQRLTGYTEGSNNLSASEPERLDLSINVGNARLFLVSLDPSTQVVVLPATQNSGEPLEHESELIRLLSRHFRQVIQLHPENNAVKSNSQISSSDWPVVQQRKELATVSCQTFRNCLVDADTQTVSNSPDIQAVKDFANADCQTDKLDVVDVHTQTLHSGSSDGNMAVVSRESNKSFETMSETFKGPLKQLASFGSQTSKQSVGDAPHVKELVEVVTVECQTEPVQRVSFSCQTDEVTRSLPSRAQVPSRVVGFYRECQTEETDQVVLVEKAHQECQTEESNLNFTVEIRPKTMSLVVTASDKVDHETQTTSTYEEPRKAETIDNTAQTIIMHDKPPSGNVTQVIYCRCMRSAENMCERLPNINSPDETDVSPELRYTPRQHSRNRVLSERSAENTRSPTHCSPSPELRYAPRQHSRNRVLSERSADNTRSPTHCSPCPDNNDDDCYGWSRPSSRNLTLIRKKRVEMCLQPSKHQTGYKDSTYNIPNHDRKRIVTHEYHDKADVYTKQHTCTESQGRKSPRHRPSSRSDYTCGSVVPLAEPRRRAFDTDESESTSSCEVEVLREICDFCGESFQPSFSHSCR